MTDPTSGALGRLECELADVARTTARLLIQPLHDRGELAALDDRADALRAEIAAMRASARKPEPVDLRSSHGGLRMLSGG